MVIDKVNVNRLARIEAERDAPIPRSSRRPHAVPVAAQRMQPKARIVRKVHRPPRVLQCRQDASQPRCQMWRNASVRAGFRKLPQPLVFDFHPAWPEPKLAIAHRVFFVRVPYLIRESRTGRWIGRGVRQIFGK